MIQIPARRGKAAFVRRGQTIAPSLLIDAIWLSRIRRDQSYFAPTVSAIVAPRSPMGFGPSIVVSRTI